MITRPLTPEQAAQWWRTAVIYQVYPRSFADSDGDGIGDLPGIISRLGYLSDLGVDAIWLSPFYASQNDGGYDVSDYRAIDPLFGTLADAEHLITEAHRCGLRVIVDLVPNHTSSAHPWFQAALAAGPGSPERARYLFRDGAGGRDGRREGAAPPNNWKSIFGKTAWTRVTGSDGEPEQWYLHLFDSTQPDLDWTNPEVADEFDSILRFWLDRGVDGFRVDVAHGLVKAPGLPDFHGAAAMLEGSTTSAVTPSEPGTVADNHQYDLDAPAAENAPMFDQDGVHEIYRRWRRVLDEYDGAPAVAPDHPKPVQPVVEPVQPVVEPVETTGVSPRRSLHNTTQPRPVTYSPQPPSSYAPISRALVAEAWVAPLTRLARYLRPGEMQQAFNFEFLTTKWNAASYRRVITDSLRTTALVGAPTTWVLSNHDVVRHPSRFGLRSDPGAKPPGISVRDEQPDEALGLRRARAATLFMLALPGSAYLYQGEELGLPEHTTLPDDVRAAPEFFRTEGVEPGRDGCRVPLPWSARQVGYGFSPSGRSWLPQPDSWARYAVDAQVGVDGSTLELYRSALALRKRLRLGAGGLEWLAGWPEEVLAFRNVGGSADVTVLANLGTEPVALPAGAEVLLASGELAGGETLPPDTTVWFAG